MTNQNSEVFDRLYEVIADRSKNPKKESYTTQLFTGGAVAIGDKVLEEAVELVQAARAGGKADVVHETADLIYHMWVLMAAAGVSLDDVRRELVRREGISGLKEKAGRKGT